MSTIFEGLWMCLLIAFAYISINILLTSTNHEIKKEIKCRMKRENFKCVLFDKPVLLPLQVRQGIAICA